MKLSVVVIVYNMAREAPRTLLSLSANFQQGMNADDYEVIIVENGSPQPLDREALPRLGKNFHYHFLKDASPSPAQAINYGLRQARGEVVGVMIDGARICTPGVLRTALDAHTLWPRAIVCTLGYYLGKDYQRQAIANGYDQRTEDRLLDSIGWPHDGYRLFEIGCLDESSHSFQPIAESNALFLRKEQWTELGGFDERFDMPGGGLVNLDTLFRACGLPDTELVILLGEGTFHQVHGGVATNSAPEIFDPRLAKWKAQYRELTGGDYDVSYKPRRYIGRLPVGYLPQLNIELNDLFDPYRGERDRLEGLLTILRGEIARLADQSQAFQADRDRVQRELDHVRGELNVLTDSTSWSVTKPLRGAYRLAQRLKRKRGERIPK